jgi:hypothetical protein
LTTKWFIKLKSAIVIGGANGIQSQTILGFIQVRTAILKSGVNGIQEIHGVLETLRSNSVEPV